MTTAIIATLIALLTNLPDNTKLEWKGDLISPNAIVRELKNLEIPEEVKKPEIKRNLKSQKVLKIEDVHDYVGPQRR